jgi:hypothetical protein
MFILTLVCSAHPGRKFTLPNINVCTRSLILSPYTCSSLGCARRWRRPSSPCIGSSLGCARRWRRPRSPCIGPSLGCARRWRRHRSTCRRSSVGCARRWRRPRSPCRCSSLGCVCSQMEAPPQSLQMLLSRLCSQMEAPPQSLHWLLTRLCSQMEAPPQSWHWLFTRLCSQMEAPSHTPQTHSSERQSPKPLPSQREIQEWHGSPSIPQVGCFCEMELHKSPGCACAPILQEYTHPPPPETDAFVRLHGAASLVSPV